MAEKVKEKNVQKDNVATRGAVLEGIVVSDKMQKTVTVRIDYIIQVPKYERMKRRHSKVKARNDIGAKLGDTVRIAECRPLSKTVHFTVIEKKERKPQVKADLRKKGRK